MIHATVGDLLDVPTARWPKKTAVTDADSSASFEELHDAVLRFAAKLASSGLTVGDRVAIVTEKNIDTLVAILATLKCGGVYVPLDVAAPGDRLRFLVDEVTPKVIIVPRAMIDATWLRQTAVSCLFLEDVRRSTASARVLSRPTPEGFAAILFTSGSTGKPKGVVLTHANIMAFFDAHNRVMQMDHASVSLNTAPFFFDVSIMDTLLPLSLGAAVHIGAALPIPSVLLRTLETHRVTHLCIVSSVLTLVTGDGTALRQHDLSCLRAIMFGAEVCSVRIIKAWLDTYPRVRMVNNYGPTETTVVCVTREVNELQVPQDGYYPIGQAHHGMKTLLRDDAGRAQVDVGARGELLLSGPQVAHGYWRRPDEQAQAFVQIGGVTHYRTGDVCTRDADGDLHYIGRRDEEVKINGYRIHLSEVRQQLQAHPNVLNGSVFALQRPDGFSSLACAVVTRSAPSNESLASLRRDLRNRLPGYMVPRYWVAVDELQRLPSGKADQRNMRRLLEDRLAADDSDFFMMIDQVLTHIGPP